MNTAQLKNFIALSQNKSFSKTEKTEFISKQALYKQINSLEEELGFRLFERNRNGIILTPEGETFLKGTVKIISDLDNLISECSDISNTDKIIHISEVEHQQLLKPVIEAYKTKNPDVSFKPVIHPNRSGEYRVAHGITDIGETFKNPLIEKDDKIKYYPLVCFPYTAVVDKNHPLANKKEADLEDCAKYKTIIFANMFPEEFISKLKTIYPASNLIIRTDVDNHIKTVYECLKTRKIFITFNPFIYSLNDFSILKIKGNYLQEYGIITGVNPSKTVSSFVDFSVKYYRFIDKK